QPVVQAFLACKLPRFVANAFKVRKRDARGGGQQRAQSSERGAGFRGIGEALPALLRPLQKRTHFVQVKAAEWRAFFFPQQNNFGSRGHGGAGTRTDGS